MTVANRELSWRGNALCYRGREYAHLISDPVHAAMWRVRTRDAETEYNMLLIDPEAALAAIPSMLPPEAEQRRKVFGLIKQVLAAVGELSVEDQKRVNEIGRLFRVEKDGSAALTPFRQTRREPQSRAS